MLDKNATTVFLPDFCLNLPNGAFYTCITEIP
jgi:hypothetical protein